MRRALVAAAVVALAGWLIGWLLSRALPEHDGGTCPRGRGGRRRRTLSGRPGLAAPGRPRRRKEHAVRPRVPKDESVKDLDRAGWVVLAGIAAGIAALVWHLYHCGRSTP